VFGKFRAPLSLIGAHAHCFAQVSKVQVYLVLASEKLLDALGREIRCHLLHSHVDNLTPEARKKPHVSGALGPQCQPWDLLVEISGPRVQRYS
jgi:hypothetical protein